MKNHFKVILITAALGLVSFNANAQFPSLGGLFGGGSKANANAVNPDEIEKSLKQMISGANRTNRLLAEALDMKELVTRSEDAAACLDKGSCGIADASAVSVSVNTDVQKKIEEMIKDGQKINQDKGDKFMRAGEGGLTQIVFLKKLMDDAKNIDNSGMAALKAATVLKNLPEGVKAVVGMFKSFESLFKVMSYSGISVGNIQTSMASEFANIGK
jgi:hypothetical protein